MSDQLPGNLSAMLAKAEHERLIDVLIGGLRERSRPVYIQALKVFAEYVGMSTPADAAQALLSLSYGQLNEVVMRFRNDGVAQGLSPSTVNTRLSVLRTLIDCARKLEMSTTSLDVENVKGEKKIETPITPEEYGRLIAATSKLKPGAMERNRLALRLLYQLGLERADVVAIDLSDVNLSNGTMTVSGRRGTQTELQIQPDVMADINAWLAYRGTDAGPLLVSLAWNRVAGEPLTGTGLWTAIAAVGKVAGIRLNPRRLRRSGITEALRATGGNVSDVRQFARHRCADSTAKYVPPSCDAASAVASKLSGLGS